MVHSVWPLLFILTSFPVFAQKLIILHTNDHHGYFMANREGHFGLAAQATIVKQIREEALKTGATVIVVSAGDMNTGAPESRFFNAKPDIEAMNKIGYEAMAVGNHEFDIPTTALKEQQKLARFPFLSSNIRTENGSLAFTPYITRQVGDKKIAIIAYTTDETPFMSPAQNRVGLQWELPDRTLVQELKKSHDGVIALSHMGYYPDEVPGRKFIGDIGLARRIPELDLIIGGHTHSELTGPVKIGKTSIVQAKEGGQRLGRIDLDLSSGSPVITKYQLIPVQGVAEDSEILKITQKYLDESNKEFKRKVGHNHLEMKGGRAILSDADAPLGNFVAEVNKTYVNADLSIVNGRGLRMGLPQGDLTYRDLVSVSPFGNTLTYVDLNGKEIWKLVETVHSKYLTKPMENAYFSKGLELVIEDGQVKNILLEGKEVPKTSSGKYRFTTGNYLAEMVDELSFIKNHPTYVNTGVTEVDAMEAFLRKSPEIHSSHYIHKTLTSRAHPCSQSLLKMLKEIQPGLN